jgi:hypothetical protein
MDFHDSTNAKIILGARASSSKNRIVKVLYLWSDWEIEATKMGQYYCNAFIIIGASSSSDSQSGIFLNRPKIS